jgi:ATP-dependent Clp protease adaptor protein ClpS
MATDELTIVKKKLQPPSHYTVVIMNDDYTPMAFVVQIIINVFRLPLEDATLLMVKVHREGRANIGSFTLEVAEHKVMLIVEAARKQEFPLMALPEKI